MASRRFKWTAAGSAVAVIGLAFVGYNLIAAQGQGILAQKPLNIPADTTPAFIMAVDDSGSMTFQTQFPGQDGEGCWSTSRLSFFDANGVVNTSGNCDYFYLMPGPRISGSYYGLPPFDSLGFARSSQYNPTYFNPTVRYEPWKDDKDVSFAPSIPSKARIDPKPTAATTTVNLTSNYYGTETFRIQRGMTYQAGAYINGTSYRNAGTWNNNISDTRVEYWPATFFVKVINGTSDPYPQLPGEANAYAGATRVQVSDACGTGCAMWKYTLPASDSDAGSKNFANWFTYYGNRNRAMIAGMTRSLSNVANLRVGYFRINQNGSYDTAAKRLPMRKMSVDTDRKALFDEMLALPASGGTPNRQAVYSATQQFTRTDDAAPVLEVCQKNAVMLFTDGFSNGGTKTVGNNDQTMGAPFSDSYFDTMADIVSKYYNNINGLPPLRPDLTAGQVPVPAACKSGNPDKHQDCQTNLHLNFYGVTLGARGNLFNPDNPQNAYTTPAIYNNWPQWENDARSTVDDIWHAAVNTRGEYINARTPAEITDAMRRVLSAVTAGSSPSGGTGFSGARIGAGSLTVAPYYEYTNEGTDWFGKLTATKLSVDPTTRSIVQTPFWEASEKLQSAASRKIFFTKNGATQEFTSGNVSLGDICNKPTQYPDMSICNTTQELIDRKIDIAMAVSYLRGDTTREVRNGGILRDRTTRIGDIVTSTPFISSPKDDYGYRRLADTTMSKAYAEYLKKKADTANYMIYVGANDGMLHAFNGGMDAKGDTVAGGGTEAFAYIPNTALGNMANLLFRAEPEKKTSQKFQHRYFVDGQIAVGDTYYGNAWRTTLVGASGAGGRGVFGLDVTPGTTFAATSKKWEISDLDTNLPVDVRNNIGFVLAKPVIVPVKVGTDIKWKAIFGNGFNSANGKAVLFVVDVADGSATMIDAVETGTGVPSGTNGLGSIVVIDRWGGTDQKVRSRDGISDTVYGTDQKGAVWKFDLRDMAKPDRPLFTSLPSTDKGLTVRQPITGGITTGTGPNGGLMLYFGTGSFSFNEDVRDNSKQTIYGVNDTDAGPTSSTVTRANLMGRTVNTSGDSRTLTAIAGAPANARGWYIDLPVSSLKDGLSERVVSNPTLANGIVSLSTYAPQPSTSGGCAATGINWFFALTPLTGEGALGRATLNSPGGTGFAVGTAGLKNRSTGSAPVLNNTPFALPRVPVASLSGGGGGGSGGGAGPAPSPPGGPGCYMGYPNGPDIVYVPYPCGRQSWRQIQ
ncbi:PilC/PilY family type IV pilus protein [uncultured Stenotrophomonas sp.]|uniref:pilus assembly protein n=1 Tax=uncultured Stenotrophomonas sp. TaxID=165438 RepID=UPI0028EE67B4|nr:PilC/PilY family type IV pilus protein [uncultured Stenotrophomonas sp.]